MRKTQLILLLMFAMLTSALFAGFWDDVLKVFADALSESSEKWGGRLTYLGAYSYRDMTEIMIEIETTN